MSDKDLSNLILRAEALMKSNWLHAIQLLLRAVEEHPEDPRPLIALGDFYMRRQLYRKAARSYQTALKLMPESDYLLMLIGNIYMAEGEFEQALVYYEQIKDQIPDVRYHRAIALANLGRHAQSITIMRELIDLIDNNPFIYFQLIEQLLRVGDHETAGKYIVKAERRIGQHRYLLLLKARNFANRQNWLHAFHCFQIYERQGEIEQAETLLTYAESAAKCGMVQKAIEILERGLARNPYSMAMYEEIVRLLIQQKRLVQARGYIKKARRFYPVLSPLLQLMQARLGTSGN